MSEAPRDIAERFVRMAFDGMDTSPEAIVQLTDEFLDSGMREAVDHIELARHGCLKGGAVELHLDLALAALKGVAA